MRITSLSEIVREMDAYCFAANYGPGSLVHLRGMRRQLVLRLAGVKQTGQGRRVVSLVTPLQALRPQAESICLDRRA